MGGSGNSGNVEEGGGGGVLLTKKSQDQFLSTLFLVERKDEGNHPVCNLKKKKSN